MVESSAQSENSHHTTREVLPIDVQGMNNRHVHELEINPGVRTPSGRTRWSMFKHNKPLPSLPHAQTQRRDNSCISCHGLAGLTDPHGWSRDLKDRNFEKSSPGKRSASPDFEWHAPSAGDDDASLEGRSTSWDNAPIEKRSASPEVDWNVSPADDDTATSLEDRGTAWDNAPVEKRNTSPDIDWQVSPVDEDTNLEDRGTNWDNAPVEERSASSENDWHVGPANDDASLEGRGTSWDNAPVEERSARPEIDWTVSPADDDTNLEDRGTNWDNGPVEKRSANPENDWHISPADDGASLEGRGTAWDNAPVEAKRDTPGASGLSELQPRGTNWDGTHGEDKRNALGPKVGQDGKATPLYGNGWELGRRVRRFLDANPSISGSRNILADRGALKTRNADADNGKSVLPASSFYPSGSWKGQNRREARTDAKEMPLVRRTEDKQDGKPMPASSCTSCMVRKWVKRWVSSPYVSSSDSSGDSVNVMSKESTVIQEKLRVARTEDSKGSVGKDGTEPVPAGGVPMPLSVERCVSQAKESGWNHKCL
ncbi:MAG: hypothetical protein Q9207_004337 [Kuettlingeria erythrocarpa]